MLNFWIAFGLFGMACVPLIIMSLVCGANLKHKLGGAVVVLIFWLIITGSFIADATKSAEAWNDGYCDCGTHWELRGATKSRMGTETKYYACPNCHAEIEL